MKYITGALVLVALLGAPETQAIRIKTTFTDDLVKSLAEDMQKDAEGEEQTPALAQQTETPKNETKSFAKDAPKGNATKSFVQKGDKPKAKKNDSLAAKKTVKKEEEDIPMDAAAIKAYSSVIADAAEESEPTEHVVYTETMKEERPAAEPVGIDPMGSMIANEITSIKAASVKAAEEKADEWVHQAHWCANQIPNSFSLYE